MTEKQKDRSTGKNDGTEQYNDRRTEGQMTEGENDRRPHSQKHRRSER